MTITEHVQGDMALHWKIVNDGGHASLLSTTVLQTYWARCHLDNCSTIARRGLVRDGGGHEREKKRLIRDPHLYRSPSLGLNSL